jgi:sec-independent protein translocase protein TatA
MFRNLGAPEIVLILIVLVLLFGAKRLPDAARSLGRSMRIFKAEVKDMGRDEESKPTPPAAREVEGRIVDPAPAAPTEPAARATAPAERTERDL